MKIEVNKEKFREWLENQPKDRLFKTEHCKFCPISEYLNEENKHYEIDVFSYGIIIDGMFNNAPEWVCDFVGLVDDSNKETISVKESIKILKEV